MEEPDVVYRLKPSRRNEELRYSLRSLANLPHGRVWTVGTTRPTWVAEDVGHIPSPERPGTKWKNIVAALQGACAAAEVSSVFVLIDDDMFVMQPLEEMPVLHRGPLEGVGGYKGTSTYNRGIRETEDLLRELGCTDFLSYELHLPLPIVKARMGEALEIAQARRPKIRCLHSRTLYGNLWHIGGVQVPDCKVFGKQDYDGRTFVSTSDSSFANAPIGKYVRARFPEPCIYER